MLQVVLAQQRLAHAKNAVAQQQHIASAKEANAAAALQRVAQEAAVEIHKAGEHTFYYIVSNKPFTALHKSTIVRAPTHESHTK